MEVLVKDSQEKEFIEDVIEIWMNSHPADAKAFHDAVHEFRRDLHRTNGMAKGKNSASMIHGFVPGVIHVTIEKYLPGFWNRPGAGEFYFSIHKKAGVKGV